MNSSGMNLYGMNSSRPGLCRWGEGPTKLHPKQLYNAKPPKNIAKEKSHAWDTAQLIQSVINAEMVMTRTLNHSISSEQRRIHRIQDNRFDGSTRNAHVCGRQFDVVINKRFNISENSSRNSQHAGLQNQKRRRVTFSFVTVHLIPIWKDDDDDSVDRQSPFPIQDMSY